MFSRGVLLLLFCCIGLCLADKTTKTAMSETGILLVTTVGISVPVLAVLLPTMIYHKYCGSSLPEKVV